MDPEDLREVISAYQKCVAETVRRFGGFVAKYMGDGVLDLLRLSAGPRGRRRASRAGGAGIGRGVSALKTARSPANTHWHRHGTGGRRRPDRIGRSAGARHRRRDAEPCGAPARHCRAEQWLSPRARESFSAICSSLRTSEQRTSRASPDRCGPGRRCGQFGGRPFRGAAWDRPDRPRRAGRRTRIAAAALVEGKDRSKAKWCCSPARPVSASLG